MIVILALVPPRVSLMAVSDTGSDDDDDDSDIGDDISHPSEAELLITNTLIHTPAQPSRHGKSYVDPVEAEETDRMRDGG